MVRTSNDWSPPQYLKFADQRTRPAFDLLSAVHVPQVGSMTDLGCGPGNSTALLVERFPNAKIAGVDLSAGMIDAARQRLPGQEFANADIATWRPSEPQSLIFANAALQWVPDHTALLPRLVSFLSSGGALAVQMPDNLNEPSHVSMRRAASDPRWHARMTNADDERTTVGSADEYYKILRPVCRNVEIWRTTYYHPLNGIQGIIDWFRSTGLRPYLNRLAQEEQGEYLVCYEQQLRQHYHLQEDGMVLLPFPRLFIVAST